MLSRLSSLIAATILLAAVSAGAAQAASGGVCGTSGTVSYSSGTATCTYAAGTSGTFTVPSSASSISVVAIGGKGGASSGSSSAPGGYGESVASSFTVSSGDQINLQVAGNGANAGYQSYQSGAGGTGGGGAGGGGADGSGGGGGGASSLTLNGSKLLVAGGGGGGGYVSGENGGNAGQDGVTVGVSGVGGPGKAGTSTAGGQGGASDGTSGQITDTAGSSGGAGSGGAGGGGWAGGGGGGSGYYGGGGGGAGYYHGGGAGGGSSYSSDPAATFTTDTTGTPLIQISWAVTTPTISAQVYDQASSNVWSGNEVYGSAQAYATSSLGSIGGGTPTGTVIYSFYNGSSCTTTASGTETVSVSGGSPPNSTATSQLAAGTHAVQAVYSGDSNYASATSQCVTFTVNPAVVHVDAGALSKTYGSADPTATATLRASDFVNGETATSAGVSGAASCAIAAHSENAGTYTGAVTCTAGTLAAQNYSFVPGSAADLTINQAVVHVDANPTSKTYGSADPAPTATLRASDLVNGETATSAGISGSVDCTLAAHSENAGTYAGAVNCTAGTLAAQNYSFVTGNSADFTINKAVVHVDANPASKIYGTVDPLATGAIRASDLANGQTLATAGISGAFICAYSSHPQSVGVYAGVITCFPSTLASTNYSFVIGNTAALTIKQASQLISFTSAPPASPTVGGTYTPEVSAGTSPNPVTITIDTSSAPGACTVSGGVVSFTGAGLCVIDANQAGNGDFLAATQTQQTLTVAKPASSTPGTGTGTTGTGTTGTGNASPAVHISSTTNGQITVATFTTSGSVRELAFTVELPRGIVVAEHGRSFVKHQLTVKAAGGKAVPFTVVSVSSRNNRFVVKLHTAVTKLRLHINTRRLLRVNNLGTHLLKTGKYHSGRIIKTAVLVQTTGHHTFRMRVAIRIP